MKNLLIKELKLSAHVLSFIFILFSAMAFIPGYPILVCAFFVCFGIFHTFQNGRETNDVLYSVLLPIDKKDVVKARFIFVCVIQFAAFLLAGAFTFIRMTLLGSAPPYAENPMMNSNPVFLAWILVVFSLFNVFFAGPFYKTAYKFGKPFIVFIVLSMLTVGVSEIAHHIPGLEFLNTSERLPTQFLILLFSFAVYAAATAASCFKAQKNFEKLDL